MGVELLRGVWRYMPSLALWKRTRAAKMAETAEKAEVAETAEKAERPEVADVAETAQTAEKAKTAEKAETAEVAETAEKAERPEVGGGSAVDRWRKSEERKAILQGLATAKDVAELEGVTDFDPRLFKMEAGK